MPLVHELVMICTQIYLKVKFVCTLLVPSLAREIFNISMCQNLYIFAACACKISFYKDMSLLEVQVRK